jgi:DNA-binding NarL/FixJ family response regulator
MDSRAPAELLIRVLVADADAMTAQLIAADLRRQQCFDAVEHAPTLMCVSDRLLNQPNSILLLSLRSQDSIAGGLELLRAVRNRHSGTRSIVLMDAAELELVSQLFQAGARGIFERSEYDPVRLCRCIECVAAGQVWAKSDQLCFVLDAFVETAPMNILSARGEELLTPREKDVVRLVADGFGNREVAQQLGLSTHTVKNYLFNIFDKLGISSRAELIMYVLSKSNINVRFGSNRETRTPLKPEPRPPSTDCEDLAG